MDEFMLGGVEIDTRIKNRDVRRLKSKHHIDLGETPTSENLSNSMAARFATDAMVVIDIAYGLYGEQLPDIKSADEFDDLIDRERETRPNLIEELRDLLTEELGGFFPLLKTVSTAMAQGQVGQLEEAAAEANVSLSGSTS